uniref:Uncharacterized protein n=1 Tax=uncultured microorganism TaxID=358574 RepID=L8B1C5_9ZZZZ|nr:hypothetical protein [uncultured microorganism]
MTDSFLRQRRNLFIVNGIILFAFYAKVKISKLTLAGVSFNGFGNPQAIYYFLWIVLAYFFYRFTLFFIEDEMANFTEVWVTTMNSRVNKKLAELATKNSVNFNENSMIGYYKVKKNNWILHYQVESEVNDYGDYSVDNIELKISRFSLLSAQLSAILKFSIITSTLTNYLLPVVLSFYVGFIVGLSSWEGALIKILT